MLTRDRDNPQNCYNGYERIAEDSERLHQVYGPPRQETLERDEIPSGIGVDLYYY